MITTMEQKDLLAIKQRFGIIGNSPALNRDIEVAVQVALTDLSVLITGESGVGKEHFPQIIHTYSARKHGPYFAINCGAIPEGTIDSELFGHEKGAFTDAKAERKGYFEIADGGTLFLDEVGELPLPTQVRLLRVLESGEFIRMGSSQVQKTNVRVVAATNLDMQRAISEGRFREDLYYRLNTVEIKVPALRERKDDIPLLFRKFVADFSDRYRMPPIRLTDEATQLLKDYYWNGNIRQLKNVAEQISVIETHREITPDTLRKYLPENELQSGIALLHPQASGDKYMNERELLYKVLFDMKRDMTEMRRQLNGLLQGQTAPVRPASEVVVARAAYEPVEVHTASVAVAPPAEEAQIITDTPTEAEPQPVTMEEMERTTIQRALQRNGNNRKQVAQELHLSERTLYRKIKEYGL